MMRRNDLHFTVYRDFITDCWLTFIVKFITLLQVFSAIILLFMTISKHTLLSLSILPALLLSFFAISVYDPTRVSADTILFSDTFTDSDNKPLPVHNPQWQVAEGNSTPIILNNKLAPSDSNWQTVTPNIPISDACQSVDMVFPISTNDINMNLRWDPVQGTGYHSYINPLSQEIVIADLQNNYFAIAPVDPTLTGTHNFKFCAVATNLDVYIDNNNVLHANDASYSTGIEQLAFIGHHLDNYVLEYYDTAPPSITINSPTGTVTTHTVAVDVSISDPSGVASRTYKLDGNTIPSDSTSLDLTYYAPGSHTFTVSAVDNVGNASDPVISEFIFSPTTSSTTSVINEMYAKGDITKLGDSLYNKLIQAQAQIDAGDYAQARTTLQALINQIEAQIDVHITTSAGNILIAQIQYLMNSLPQ